VQKFFAEVPGTAALVFTGCGAFVDNDLQGIVLGRPGICQVYYTWW
jgi:glycerol uptake facilitator-like aquaporin